MRFPAKSETTGSDLELSVDASAALVLTRLIMDPGVKFDLLLIAKYVAIPLIGVFVTAVIRFVKSGGDKDRHQQLERRKRFRLYFGRLKLSMDDFERKVGLEPTEARNRVDQVDRSTSKRFQTAQGFLVAQLVVAAAVVSAGVAVIFLDAHLSKSGISLWAVLGGSASYTTKVGEQRSIALDDGSLVLMNTDSKMVVKFGGDLRSIRLERGEARFFVAKNLRVPFVVTTPQADVVAVGTTFNVRIGELAQRTEVAVLEGTVRVVARHVDPRQFSENNYRGPASPYPAANSLPLAVNARAAVTDNGKILAESGAPLERAKGWTENSLVFRDEPLQTVVEEFNRYSVTKMRVADPELGFCPMTLTLHSYEREALLEYLREFMGVEVVVGDDGVYVLRGFRNKPLNRSECSAREFKRR